MLYKILVRFTLLELTSTPLTLFHIVLGLQAAIQKFYIGVKDNIESQSGDNCRPQGQFGIRNINPYRFIPYHSTFLKVCSYVG